MKIVYWTFSVCFPDHEQFMSPDFVLRHRHKGKLQALLPTNKEEEEDSYYSFMSYVHIFLSRNKYIPYIFIH